MSDPQPLTIDNENSLEELAWAIATSQKEFSLILALCNAANLRKRLVQSLQASSDLEIREIVLDKSIKTFFQTIQDSLGLEHPQVLVVSGLEAVTKLEQVLSAANQVREELRKNFHFPLVLWVTDEVLHKLIRLAPDLHSWSTTVEFAIATDDLIDFIQQTANEVFEKVLAAGAGRYLDNTALNLQIGSPRRVELESAWHDLQNRRLSLNPELEASLEFMLGRATSSSLEVSGQHYERSLILFSQDTSSLQFLERRACLQYSMGLWWRTYAVLHHPERDRAHNLAKDYFQQCIEVFEQANRQELVAKFINALGAILQSLHRWEELEVVANKALALHQTYFDRFKLARAYGFMAEVAIAKSAWNEAKRTAQQALSLLDSVQIDTANPVSEEMKADLDWERSYHRGWYLFALARSQSALNLSQAALETLETAKTETKPQYDPELYIHILADLRASYFQKGEYLTAFHLKQEQRSIEQQYGFRAFIGAGRLQPQQTENNPALPSFEQQATVATEIAASGRQQDINRLIERMGQSDRKLTIIHGQSGVGKSSILQAGLIPALKQKSIATRDVLPVLQQVYPDWIGELNNRLRDALCYLTSEVRGKAYSPPLLEEGLGQRSILNQLAKHDDYNLLTVLIFDQFEEFFFIYKDPTSRRPFYEFLRECLDIPFVKVILSLREDYVYYLLECNNRLANFEVINNNILDKDILYFLDNFSVEDAKKIIQTLTEKSQLVLEGALINELVNDLARDLGEVRPIELQVVGAQLQTEKITSLEQYQQHGPKENFVGRFLEQIVKDCGSDNEQIAKLVLYLLTDENNTRPLKNRADLELELDIKAEKLDLVLEILIKSGLVLRVPASPADRYQLVHDYLVPFVRQQQSARLIAELEKEREQRKLTEAKLNEVLQQQLLETRRGLVWKVALGAIAGGLAIFLPLVLISQNNANLYSMTQESKNQLNSNKDLEALVEALKAGKRLQQWWSIGVQPETQMKLVTTLQDVVYKIRERNSLEGYKDTVTRVSFSHDSQRVVTGSEDGTVKIWSRDGREIPNFNFRAYNKKITSVSFSRDDQMVVAGSEDGKVLLIRSRDGKEIANFQGYEEEITSINFSPDGQKLISASKDKTFKLWNLKGEVITTFKGHKESVNSVSFSPDGQLIVSGSEDNMVKLWTLNGKAIKTLNNEIPVTEVTFSPDGQTIASAGEYNNIKLWRRNGSLIKTLSSSGSVSFSPDSKSIALTSFSESTVSVEIDQIDTENTGTTFELKGHGNNITSVSVSPDFQMLASGSEDRTVKLWSLEKNRDFKNPDESVVNNVSFSPNSQLIASVSGEDNVRLWKQNGALKTTLPGHNSQLSFSPDSQMLVTASEDRTVQLWRRDGTFIKTLQGDVIPGSFSSDGRTIALVKNDNRVELSTSNGKYISTLKGDKNRVKQITFSPNGETIATYDENKTIKVWQRNGKLINIINGNEYKSIGFSYDGEVLAIQNGRTLNFWQRKGKKIKSINDLQGIATFSPDGKLIAIIRPDIRDKRVKFKLELWRIDGTLLRTFSEINIYIYDGISRPYFTEDSQVIVYQDYQQLIFWRSNGYLLSKIDKNVNSFSPDLQTLATMEEKNSVKLWKSDGTFLRTIQVKTKKANIESITFNDDGQTLVIHTNKNTLEIWRQDGTWLKTIIGLNNRKIERLATDKIEEQDDELPMSFKDKTLAIRTQENEVQLWRIDSNTSTNISPIKTIKNQGNWVKEVNFVNTDTIAIVSGVDVVKLWQIPSAIGKKVQLLQSMKGHTNQITSISISPNGQLIASASKDNTVKLWRTDGKLLKTFRGHKDNVNSISFSPDSQLIASASDDKTVKVWQLDGKMLMSFDKHDNSVNSVNFSPDGKMIASASKDRTVRVWSLEGKERKNLYTEEPVNKVSFSPNGQMIASASDKTVKLSSIDGTLLATFSDRFGNDDVSFSLDGKTIAAPLDNGISVWNFDLKELLKRGCDEAHDYLKNNPKAGSDRYLCDDIYKKK
ncbi:nSTAND1 domain-containing NTPase [Nostoc sp.]|uniref:WD40 domain-containing protein n=1 Tax=Nostoc sp. TaxID=1180 RepID=UPI002FF914D7